MHPIFYLAAQFAAAVLIVGFTRPNSVLRYFGLFGNLFCAFRCIPLCMSYMVRTPWAALLGGYSVTYLYHYLDIALLSRWSFEEKAPVSGLIKPVSNEASQVTSASKDKPLVLQRLLFGLKVTSAFRFIGTPYQVRSVPPAICTTRKAYIQRTLAVVTISYVLLDFISSNNDPTIASKFLTVEKIPFFTRLYEVSAEELIVRMFTVLAAGISLNCVQGGIYHLIGLFAVCTGVSEPSAWPPFYGSLQEAYTLRGFWNVFWHQTNVRKFSSIAHYVVHYCLALPRGTVGARYLRSLVAFMSSGIMHLLDDLASGIPVHNSGAMRFFLTQAAAVVIEDCVMRLYRRLPEAARAPKAVEKTIGFFWVSLFLTWSVPAYIYPMLWRTKQGLNDSTIPFSFFSTGSERAQALGCLLSLSFFSGFALLINGD